MPGSTLPNDTSLEVTHTFAAPRARVFAAWMDPEALTQWYRMDGTWKPSIAEVDLRVGGSYRIGMQPPGLPEPFFETGTFREIVANERLVYTNALQGTGTAADHEGTLVTVTFADTADGGCTVTVREEGFPSLESRDVHAAGWPGFLEQLDGVTST